MERTKIIVDDIRIEPHGWLLFKTAEDFIDWLTENPNTIIDCLSLDHDLGEFIMSGYDLVHYMVDDIEFPKIKRIQFHTDNMVGLKNMHTYIVNAQKHGVIPEDLKIIKEKLNLYDGRLSFSGYSYA